MVGVEEKLRDYVKDLLENKEYNYLSKKTRDDWAFGAIDFCVSAKFIDSDTYDTLTKEFGLT